MSPLEVVVESSDENILKLEMAVVLTYRYVEVMMTYTKDFS